MSGASLEVWLPTGLVGTLRRSPQGLVRWAPDPAWLAQGQSPRLGLGFLADPGPRVAGTGLPAWFENLLPEVGSALRARLARIHGIRPTDSFGLLGALGPDLPGAVTVVPQGALASAPGRDPGDGQPIPSHGAAEAPRLRFSLAGMQLKLSMTAAGERLAVPARDQLGAWIVKLPGRGYAALPQVEHATMRWAAAAGHPVPQTRVVPVSALDGLPAGWVESGGDAFAIERFDRRADGTRVHHEDLCQALELLPDHKYGDDPHQAIGYDGLVRLVVDACGEGEGRQLARRVGFVIASGNNDAHLKNWSLCWGAARRPTLSPVYDHVATVSWPAWGWDADRPPTLGLSLGGKRSFAALTGAVLDRFVARSGQAWAADELRRGILDASAAVDALGPSAPEAMRRALTEHWRRVPILREVAVPPFI